MWLKYLPSVILSRKFSALDVKQAYNGVMYLMRRIEDGRYSILSHCSVLLFISMDVLFIST